MFDFHVFFPSFSLFFFVPNCQARLMGAGMKRRRGLPVMIDAGTRQSVQSTGEESVCAYEKHHLDLKGIGPTAAFQPIWDPTPLIQQVDSIVGGHRRRFSRRGIIGREQEVRKGRNGVADLVLSGFGTSFLVEGASGLGKSTCVNAVLATELASEQSDSTSVAIAAVTASNSEQLVLGSLIRRIFRSLFGHHVDERLIQGLVCLGQSSPQLMLEFGDVCRLLGFAKGDAVLDSTDGEDTSSGESDDHHHASDTRHVVVKDVAVAMIKGVCQVCKLVLVVDDIQWADSLSLEILTSLAESIRSSRDSSSSVALALFMTSRPVSDQDERAGAFAKLTETCLENAELQPLGKKCIGRLIVSLAPSGATSVDEAVLRDFFEKSGGSPFYAEALASHAFSSEMLTVSPEGEVIRTGGGDASMPLSIELVVQERVAALSPPDAEIVQICAILGFQFSRLDASAVVRRASETVGIGDVSERIMDLTRLESPFLKQDGSTSWCFEHAILHETVYRSIPVRQRLRIHCIHADTLLERSVVGASVARALIHAERFAEAREHCAAAVARAFDTSDIVGAVAWLSEAEHTAERSGRPLSELSPQQRQLLACARVTRARLADDSYIGAHYTDFLEEVLELAGGLSLLPLRPDMSSIEPGSQADMDAAVNLSRTGTQALTQQSFPAIHKRVQQAVAYQAVTICWTIFGGAWSDRTVTMTELCWGILLMYAVTCDASDVSIYARVMMTQFMYLRDVTKRESLPDVLTDFMLRERRELQALWDAQGPRVQSSTAKVAFMQGGHTSFLRTGAQWIPVGHDLILVSQRAGFLGGDNIHTSQALLHCMCSSLGLSSVCATTTESGQLARDVLKAVEASGHRDPGNMEILLRVMSIFALRAADEAPFTTVRLLREEHQVGREIIWRILRVCGELSFPALRAGEDVDELLRQLATDLEEYVVPGVWASTLPLGVAALVVCRATLTSFTAATRVGLPVLNVIRKINEATAERNPDILKIQMALPVTKAVAAALSGDLVITDAIVSTLESESADRDTDAPEIAAILRARALSSGQATEDIGRALSVLEESGCDIEASLLRQLPLPTDVAPSLKPQQTASELATEHVASNRPMSSVDTTPQSGITLTPRMLAAVAVGAGVFGAALSYWLSVRKPQRRRS
jgi:AAA ATPase domain